MTDSGWSRPASPQNDDMDSEYQGSKTNRSSRSCLSFMKKRYVLLLLCFLNAMVSYADRTNIAIAIIPMAEHYNWSLTTQGLILSSFFYGYICTQLLAGYLSYRYGGKPVLAVSCFFWSLFTVLTPVASNSMFSLLICRVLLGLSEGFGFPAIQALIPVYIPREEHSRSIAIVLSGSYAGAVLANLVSPAIIKNPVLGWEYVFYLFGSIGLFWLIPWLFFQPEEVMGRFSKLKLEDGTSRFINQRPTASGRKAKKESFDGANPDQEFAIFEANDKFELTQLTPSDSVQDVREQTFTTNSSNSLNDEWKEPAKKLWSDVPWKILMSRKEVWAIIIAQFCQGWSYWLLINWLPTYYKDVFGVDIMHVGFFTVVPYVVQGLCGLSAGFLSDYLINTVQMKKLYVRRLMQCGGMLGSALFMLLASAIAQDIYQGMIYVSLSAGVYCLTFGGVSVNHLDIAPDYAAIVYGIGNTAGQLPGMIGVYLTGLILDVTNNNWNVVFSLSALISAFGSVAWTLMSGDEVIVGNAYYND